MPGYGNVDVLDENLLIDSSLRHNYEEYHLVYHCQSEFSEKGEPSFRIQSLIHDLHRCGSIKSTRRQKIEEDLVEEWLSIASFEIIHNSSSDIDKTSYHFHQFPSYGRKRRMRKSKTKVTCNDRVALSRNN